MKQHQLCILAGFGVLISGWDKQETRPHSYISLIVLVYPSLHAVHEGKKRLTFMFTVWSHMVLCNFNGHQKVIKRLEVVVIVLAL